MNLEANLQNVHYIFFDVDNTLIGNESDKLPSERFRAAAKRAKDVGLGLGIASARPLQKVQYILDACDMSGYSIVSNGAQIYDGAKDAMVEEYVIPKDVAERLLIDLQTQKVVHWVQDDGKDHFWHERRDYMVAENYWDRADRATTKVEDYVPNKPFVIMAHNVSFSEKERLLEEARRFQAEHVAALILHEVKSETGEALFDVAFVHEQGNKHAAIERVIELSGAEKEAFMAVGDGHNDLVIIANVGVGVAVANAVPEVKEAALLQVPAWNEDGAAIALEQVLAAQENDK